MTNLPHPLRDLFTLLSKVFDFVCGVFRWLIWV